MSSDIAKGVIEKLKEENAALRAEVNVTRKNYEEYKTENITLREEVVKANGLLDMQMKELAKLREDKERLDWVLSNSGGSWVYWQNEMCEWEPNQKASRAAIDAARNEAQQ